MRSCNHTAYLTTKFSVGSFLPTSMLPFTKLLNPINAVIEIWRLCYILVQYTIVAIFKAPPPKSPDQPRVLVTTSLLSRGIDFDPSVRHVLIVDAPRNMVDFVHRAGRTARAGMEGKVVIFGKRKGRGSAEGDRFMEKLKELTGKV